ncbi:hypothetical protein ONS95_009762 [Cadophora gregata]|uniref:uncharacterized protein n=1 Tax=Cadophora gregata TaxID=51156 RepID=UPI0026DCDB90|nr:uncharacterized protein ONS95_009762 [Cadophora gregata]KAK0121468.1 hypothetical protein ONS95_009762 [Cadophora gregata]
MAASDYTSSVSSSSSSSPSPIKHSRSKPYTPSIPLLPSAIPLIFINETERLTSSQIRRDIRSQVRKGSHERQRRLNAAAKARPLEAVRKLVRKGAGKEGRGEGRDDRAKLVPGLRRLRISGVENDNERDEEEEDDDDDVMGHKAEEKRVRGGKFSFEVDGEMLQHVKWEFPVDVDSGTGFGSSSYF